VFLRDLIDTAKEVADQLRTTAENPKSSEDYMQGSGSDDIGMQMMFSPSPY
jgi:hypothetical protein